MKEIPLTRGYKAQVSNADYEWLVKMGKWQAAICGYSVYARRSAHINGKKVTQYMHRVIMGVTDPEKQVDHKDGQGLKNLRCNLEIVTLDENVRREHIRLGNRE
jgi:hypothetical protein